MTARMVATHRRYTKQQKAAYRARLRRRHLHGGAHRIPLRMDWEGLTRAAESAGEAMRRAAEDIRAAARSIRPPVLPGVRLTAESLLGMDAQRRGATLDEILNLPPAESYFHNAAPDLPEGWTQT